MSDESPYAAPSADITRPDNDGIPHAKRHKRLGGAIIDGLVMAIIYVPIVIISGNWGQVLVGQETQQQAFLLCLIGITVCMII